MVSNRTKQCRALKWLFIILHLLCLIGPFCYFIPFAYATGPKSSQIVLTCAAIVSLIILVFSIIVDVKHRAGLHKSIVWLLVAGVISCVGELDITFIWVMVVVSLIDELIVIPVKEHYKTALIANVEIDKRG